VFNVSSPLSCNFDQGSLPDALRGMENNQFLLDNPLALWKKLVQFRHQRKPNKRTGRVGKFVIIKPCESFPSCLTGLTRLVPQPTKEIINLHNKSEEIERNIANALSRASQLRDKKDKLEKIKESMDGNATVRSFASRIVYIYANELFVDDATVREPQASGHAAVLGINRRRYIEYYMFTSPMPLQLPRHRTEHLPKLHHLLLSHHSHFLA